jgi:hypothetical protein
MLGRGSRSRDRYQGPTLKLIRQNLLSYPPFPHPRRFTRDWYDLLRSFVPHSSNLYFLAQAHQETVNFSVKPETLHRLLASIET